MVNFPQNLDTDTELHQVQDEVHDVIAEHHNVLKDAIIALETKVGANDSTDPNSLDSKKLNSVPPDGFSRVQNIYLKEIDQEIILIT